MLVGDTQRIEVYAERGFAIPQHMPDEVRTAYRRLVKAGFTSRLLQDGVSGLHHHAGLPDLKPIRPLRSIAALGTRGRDNISRTIIRESR
jgi:hypothetical protein